MPIELNNVSYTYLPGTAHECVALRDVCLHIDDGEFVGIMGESGCGKSTLIQLICGLLFPSSGTVSLDGCDINGRGFSRQELRRAVGVVFQYPEKQLFETTVERDVSFTLKRSGLSRAEISDRLHRALDSVGLDFDRVRSLSPLSFSGGEKRRIALAGILVARPRVLLLDEPTASLDLRGREDLLRLLVSLNAEGTTILMVSHDADSLAESCGRLLVLDSGRIVDDGPVSKVFSGADGDVLPGRGVSQVWEIARLLRARGVCLPASISGYDELIDALKRLYGQGAKV